MIRSFASFCLLSFLLFIFALNVQAQEKEIVGYLEKVRIFPEDILIHVKLDTGADISAVNAQDIVGFEKNGQEWVRFTVRNRFGEEIRLEREVKRIARIKQHSDSTKSQKRYVVNLGICLGSAYMEEEVSLVNRSQFKVQMLLGRSFLGGNVVIDPAQTYLAEPNCPMKRALIEEQAQEDSSKKKKKKKKIKVKKETEKPSAEPTIEEKVIEEEAK